MHTEELTMSNTTFRVLQNFGLDGKAIQAGVELTLKDLEKAAVDVADHETLRIIERIEKKTVAPKEKAKAK